MGNPTTEIRAKLDESRVEWWPSDDPQCEDIITHWRVEPLQWTAIEGEKGLWLNAGIAGHEPLTPEQAIAATVGAGTLTAEQVRKCAKGVYFEGYSDGATHRANGIEETDWQAIADELNATVGRCDTMGLWLEWEQVLFANVSDEVAQDNLNECVHELLDKAATLGAGTCKMAIEKRPRHGPWIYHFGCGYDFWQPTDCPMPILKHCPNCGKRIEEVSE